MRVKIIFFSTHPFRYDYVQKRLFALRIFIISKHENIKPQIMTL